MRINIIAKFSLLFILMPFLGCKKWVAVNTPVTSINNADIYNSDATATAVLTGIYANMSNNFMNGGILSMCLFPELSADNLSLYAGANNPTDLAYYDNNLTNLNTQGSDFWSNIYPLVYVVNSALEGLNGAKSLTPAVKQQLIGEAKFMRAFFYFYLVNLYGDVPLVTTTNYNENAFFSRTSQAIVWRQIITDLHDAQNALSSNYLDASLINTTSERVRPTKWADTALLARTYLFQQKWDSAEAEATTVISNSSIYSLDTLNGVFLKNNPEAIWQLQPVVVGLNSQEAQVFILPPQGPDNMTYIFYLDSTFVADFEPGDLRRTNWIDSVYANNSVYYYPYKYKVNAVKMPVTEYEMVFRLGEQYLVRAEARAQQQNIVGAQADLDSIRARAGLANANANDQASLLTAISKERRAELFTEWGHRWLDLKRTASIDSVMKIATPRKDPGMQWNSFQQLYPVPLAETQLDREIIQNIGY
jgi:starch-binding outer membrane protein, SusD/RagB family